MAHTIEDIQNEILTAKDNEPALAPLNSTSKVAVWRLWVYIFAFVIQSLERLFDLHKADIDEQLLQLKPHTARWYRNKALAFQHGFNLLPESDVFDNSGKSEDEIAASKIVKYAAVTEDVNQTRLIIKIATEAGDKLSQIPDDVATAFKAYMSRIKDAGVPITVINYLPDQLRLSLVIVYNPLLLTREGISIANGNEPVADAIRAYLKALPFDGELSVQALTDRIQQAEGVEDVQVLEVLTRWIDPTANAYGTWQSVGIVKVPESGYFDVSFTDATFKSTLTYKMKTEL